MYGNVIWTTFWVSYAVTLMCLPFYYRADIIKEEVNEKLQKLEPDIENIKRNFKGNERFFMLKTLYRQNNYHPLMALRSSFGLLIQIPFFIAAYHFFSHLDLGLLSKPDGLLHCFGYKINFLPILMTVINIAACEMYLKTKTFAARIQPYSFAFIFLILLYQSPAILVLYWTFNNILFALKNICLHKQNPLKKITLFSACLFAVLYINFHGASYWIAGIQILNLPIVTYVDLLLLYIFIKNYKTVIEKIDGSFQYFKQRPIQFIAILSAALAVYLINKSFVPIIIFILSVYLIYKMLLQNWVQKLHGKFKNYFLIKNSDNYEKIFIISCVCLFLLQSLFIPTNVISTDANMFSLYTGEIKYIYQILIYQVLYLLGFYIFWAPVLFSFIRKEYRLYAALSASSLIVYFLINYLTFGRHLGTISTEFTFSDSNSINVISGGSLEQILNVLLFFAILAIIIVIYNKFKAKPIISLLLIILFSQILTIGLNTKNIVNSVKNYKLESIGSSEQNSIELTKTGKNVMIIFLDRFLSSFMPIILKEKPELKELFSGFTYYPNTISFYGHTILGEPPMIGGYEYTPINLDKDPRDFSEKFKEANLVLLTLFKNNGYISTITDAVGEFDTNIRFINDFHKYYTDKGFRHTSFYGKFNTKLALNNKSENYIAVIKSQCVKFSLLNICPKFLKKSLYKAYFEKNQANLSFEEKVFEDFYSALYYLDKVTNTNAQQNTFTIINNEAPHYAHYLQYPDYELINHITDIGSNPFDDTYSFQAYHSTIASLLQIAKYFNYLKEHNVYDNTKIIIVSDHGCYFVNNNVIFPQFSHSKEMELLTAFNPLLMVKDFNAKGKLKQDNTFMTNADTPYLAVHNLIENAKNPFTGKEFSINEKLKGVDIYTNHNYFWKGHFKGNRTVIDKYPKFYHVSDDALNIKNWKKIEYNH